MFRHKEDVFPISVIFIYFLIDISIFFSISNVWILALWYVLGIWPKSNISSWSHNHHHSPVFRSKYLNFVLELMYGLQTGLVGNTWVLEHVCGHHSHYLDPKKDSVPWIKDNRIKSLWEYSTSVILNVYPRSIAEGMRRRRLLYKMIAQIGATSLILYCLFLYSPVAFLFVFVLPMLTALITTACATYHQHVGMSLENVYAASRNVISSPSFNALTGNMGYHTAHHIRCGLHWSKLPALHKEIEQNLSKDCYMQPHLIYRVADIIVVRFSYGTHLLVNFFQKR